MCSLLPSNGRIPDWRRLEGGEIVAGGNFVWIESEEAEERTAEVRLKVTSVIFVKPEAWSKIIVPLVLGQGGGLDSLIREAREVRRRWIDRVRKEFEFEALETERFARAGELPRASYPMTVWVPSFVFSRESEGRRVRLLERGKSLGLPFGALWTLYMHCIDQGIPPRRKLWGIFRRLGVLEKPFTLSPERY